LAGCGTQTAALAFGGFGTDYVTTTEEYDGNSWTNAAGSLNLGRQTLTGFGIQTAALAAGGESPSTGATEEYNGISWATVNPLNTARHQLSGCGTQTAGLAFGGAFPIKAATEEWTGPGAAVTKTITVS
jgi:hypothetical protein